MKSITTKSAVLLAFTFSLVAHAQSNVCGSLNPHIPQNCSEFNRDDNATAMQEQRATLESVSIGAHFTEECVDAAESAFQACYGELPAMSAPSLTTGSSIDHYETVARAHQQAANTYSEKSYSCIQAASSCQKSCKAVADDMDKYYGAEFPQFSNAAHKMKSICGRDLVAVSFLCWEGNKQHAAYNSTATMNCSTSLTQERTTLPQYVCTNEAPITCQWISMRMPASN